MPDWARGYVYLGAQMLAIQTQGSIHWVHEAPVVKSQRFTNSAGTPESSLEMDEWGGETNRSDNQSSLTSYQPHRFATYERDGNSNDYAMARTYHAWLSRFDQPDPSDGSYDLSDPQSFNRYAYVQNDPVNNIDPSGLCPAGKTEMKDAQGVTQCVGVGNNPVNVYSGGGGTFDPYAIGYYFYYYGSNYNYYTNSGYSGGGGGPVVNPGEPPQNTAPTSQPNPNCIQNAVSGATGLARPFGNVDLNTGSIGHDGIHVMAPPGSRVTTLPALTGRVLGIHSDIGSKIVDVLLKDGNVAIYKDLEKVNVRPGQVLRAGSNIGTVGNGGDYGGLHFSLLKGGRAGDNAYRAITSGRSNNIITVGMFTDPNGPNSPVNCPGVSVNLAGVNPYP